MPDPDLLRSAVSFWRPMDAANEQQLQSNLNEVADLGSGLVSRIRLAMGFYSIGFALELQEEIRLLVRVSVRFWH